MDLKVFTKKNVPLFLILLIALVIRLGLFILIHPEHPERAYSPDSFEYLNSALSIYHTGQFNQDASPGSAPETKRTPGYPALIAAVYFFAGEGNDTVFIIIQILIGSILIPWFTYILGHQLLSHRIGLIAAGLIAIDPGHIVFSFSVLTETIYTVILMGAMIFLVKSVQKRRDIVSLILCIVLVSAATYIRPASLYLPMSIFLGFLLITLMKYLSWKQLAIYGIVIVCSFTVCIVPWQLRNIAVAGANQFSTHVSHELQIRAARIYDEIHKVGKKQSLMSIEKGVLETTDTSKKMNERQIEYAVNYIIAHPWVTTKMLTKGFYQCIVGLGTFPLLQYLGLAEYPEDHVYSEKKFLLNNFRSGNYGLFIFHAGMIAINVITILAFLCGLVLLGLLTIRKKTGTEFSAQRSRKILAVSSILLAVIFYFLLVSSATDAYFRYRSPVMPIMVVFSAFFIDWLVKKIFKTKPTSSGKLHVSNQ